ncbi:MAG: sulfotransferase, partial [Verrucomicrobia bacterium]|nr:sulfotransferase [Verrucomicrobiota bacterium]
RTVRFSGPNDALHIWDRWLGRDRAHPPTQLSDAEKDAMRRFFGAYQQVFHKPLVNKNNLLNTCAHLVADVFDNAFFICLKRNPVYLAQSLLKSRLDIHGSTDVPYGVNHRNPAHKGAGLDMVEDVCRQVLFHQKMTAEQERRVGPDRFWVVSYEDSCQKPEELLTRVSDEILGKEIKTLKLKPFNTSNRVKIEPGLFNRIEQTLNRFGESGIINQPISDLIAD